MGILNVHTRKPCSIVGVPCDEVKGYENFQPCANCANWYAYSNVSPTGGWKEKVRMGDDEQDGPDAFEVLACRQVEARLAAMPREARYDLWRNLETSRHPETALVAALFPWRSEHPEEQP